MIFEVHKIIQPFIILRVKKSQFTLLSFIVLGLPTNISVHSLDQLHRFIWKLLFSLRGRAFPLIHNIVSSIKFVRDTKYIIYICIRTTFDLCIDHYWINSLVGAFQLMFPNYFGSLNPQLASHMSHRKMLLVKLYASMMLQINIKSI